MADGGTPRRKWGGVIAGSLCVLAALAGASMLFMQRQEATAAAQAGDITGSVSTAGKVLGQSGLPVPRFVSLKADKVNVRRGPSSDHKVAWVFQRKGLPVEIVAEFENWRRIRDSDGEEGWVYQSMLSGKRTISVAPWRKEEKVPLYSDTGLKGGLVARVEAGVVGTLDDCSGEWCAVTLGDYRGYIQQNMLWGVYPGEQVSD